MIAQEEERYLSRGREEGGYNGFLSACAKWSGPAWRREKERGEEA